MSRKEILAKSRNKRAKKNLHKFLFLAFFVFVVGSVGVVFFLRITRFNVQSISIQGNTVLNGEEITEIFLDSLEGEFLKVIPRNNIFVFPKAEIIEKLKEEFPRIKSIDIDRNMPNTLEVKITERESTALFCENGGDKRCLFVDENGFVFEKAPFFSGDIFVKFFDESENPPIWKRGFQLVPQEWLKSFIDFVLLLEGNGVSAEKVVFEKEGLYKIYTTEGWYILLNRDNNLERVSGNLKIAFQEELGENRGSLEYVDLRLENKVFSKFR